ncbi:MAG TPA: hypothetical protein ENK65_01670 [Helicobacteraceae bacterium]|nr:hypothetical protein [Helicobacteraceae bacterium]
MIRYLILISLLIFTSGCVNKRGVSSSYYNDCEEYYDLQGTYHKECDENMLEFQDVKNAFKTKETPPQSNVW